MHRPLARAIAASTAVVLSLSLLLAPPAVSEETDEPPADPLQEDLGESDARALAEQTGEPVEINELTDEKTQHFANPDGTLTMHAHAQPVRVRSEQGWTDVDTTLYLPGDGDDLGSG